MASAIESLPPPGWDGPQLDPLLRLLPPGQLSEIVGSRSSGATSLLLALLARATREGGLVALVDAADAFDPAGAATAGVDLSAVLWVRCGGRLDAAFRAVDLLAHCPGFAMVALDVGIRGHRADATPARWLRLSRAVEGTRTVLVARTPERLSGSVAALVLAARRARARWIGAPRPTRLAGLVSHVEVTRARRAPSAIPPVSSIEWPA